MMTKNGAPACWACLALPCFQVQKSQALVDRLAEENAGLENARLHLHREAMALRKSLGLPAKLN